MLLSQPLAVCAQGTAPTLLWSKTRGVRTTPFYALSRYYHGLLQTTSGQYRLYGSKAYYDSLYHFVANSPVLLTLDAQGDSVRVDTCTQALADYGYAAVQSEPNGLLVGSGVSGRSSVDQKRAFFATDTLGRLAWRYEYPPAPGYFAYDEDNFGAPIGQRHARIPDGYLLINNQRGPTSAVQIGGALRIDRHGQLRRSFLSGHPHPNLFRTLVPVPDGSYLAVGAALYPNGLTPAALKLDVRCYRFRASGDTIASYRVGVRTDHEDLHAFHPAPGGGYIVAGYWVPASPPPGTPDTGRGEITKLDSQFHVQWRYHKTGADNSGSTSSNCEFMDVQPTQDGGFVAMGYIVGPTQFERAALLVGLDATGNEVWEQRYPATGYPAGAEYPSSVLTQWVYNPDGTAVLLGVQVWYLQNGPTTQTVTYHRLLKLTGLALPWMPDWCAIPPAPPKATRALVNPITYEYRADTTTGKGPPYAEASYYIWHWGDSTAADTGRVVQHAFVNGLPAPRQVRLCVLNNLFCETCATVDVLGLGETTAGAALTVWPNPSADGRFRVRGAAGASLTVTDALGRVVLSGATGSGVGQVVDLSGQAPGVYALRLRWPDGTILTKRLLK